MRQFFRTAAGKTILFLLCGIFGVIFTATVAGSVVLVEQDFYTREEADLREEVFDGLLYRDGQSLAWRAENDMLSEEEDGETGNLTWQIVGTDGKVKAGKKDTKIKEEKKVWKKISFEKQGVTIKTSDTTDTSGSQN